MNEFYVFQQELLRSPNKSPAENCRCIKGDFYVETTMTVSENKLS